MGDPWSKETGDKVMDRMEQGLSIEQVCDKYNALLAVNERLTEAFDLADGLRKAHQAEIERLHEAMDVTNGWGQEMRDRYSEKCARVEALEGVVKAAHDELMNLQPHIPECCYPQKQPFIDAHVDVAMELLAATEQETDFDPFTDANDDYAVLEWMRQNIDADNPLPINVKVWKFAEILNEMVAFDYRIGNYARAALKVMAATEQEDSHIPPKSVQQLQEAIKGSH